MTERLAATRLGHGEDRVFATPRRLVAMVEAVAPRESDRVRTVRGPRVGAPAKAVEGFARSQGVEVTDLKQDDGHSYVERFEAGSPALVVLAGVLAGVVTGLRAAKNMRWRCGGRTWCRWRCPRWLPAGPPGCCGPPHRR